MSFEDMAEMKADIYIVVIIIIIIIILLRNVTWFVRVTTRNRDAAAGIYVY